MKRIQLIIYSLCLLLATASLATAFVLAGHWWILAALAGMLLLALLMREQPVFRSAIILLAIYVGVSAIGMLLGLSTLFILVGGVSALGAWDLAIFAEDMRGNSDIEDGSLRTHLPILLLACGLGLGLAVLSTTLRLRIPFGVMVVLALLAVGGLVYGIRQARRSNS